MNWVATESRRSHRKKRNSLWNCRRASYWQSIWEVGWGLTVPKTFRDDCRQGHHGPPPLIVLHTRNKLESLYRFCKYMRDALPVSSYKSGTAKFPKEAADHHCIRKRLSVYGSYFLTTKRSFCKWRLDHCDQVDHLPMIERLWCLLYLITAEIWNCTIVVTTLSCPHLVLRTAWSLASYCH